MALKAAAEFKRSTVDITAADGTTVQATERCWFINYTSCTQNNPFTAARVVDEHLYKSPYINPSGTGDTKSDYLKHIGIMHPTLLMRRWPGASISAITIRSTSRRLRTISRTISRPACA